VPVSWIFYAKSVTSFICPIVLPRDDDDPRACAAGLRHVSAAGWAQVGLLALLVAALARPLGGYIVRVYAGEETALRPILRPVESALYRLAGVDAAAEQTWLSYAVSLLAFNAVGTVVLYALLRLQDVLPLDPQNLPATSPDLSLDTAISFATNTSWQSYAGEATLSHLAQMAGVAVQSFLSAATGMAVAMALIRGIARRTTGMIGNFWTDVTRGVLYVLLPICAVAALFFIFEGVPQTLDGYAEAHTIAGETQLIARGPVASQEAIKLLSGDGGGFFNVNSAHPFENPTPLTNLVEMVLMIAIGAAMTNSFGRMVGNGKARRCASALPRRRCSPRPRPRPPTAPSMRCMTASGRLAARC
jgi:K+-transporting ATPase ATPase A chain